MWELLNKARVFIEIIELQVAIGSMKNIGNIVAQAEVKISKKGETGRENNENYLKSF